MFGSIDVSSTKLQMASHIVKMVVPHAVCRMEVALGRLTNGPNHDLMRFLCIDSYSIPYVPGSDPPLMELLAHLILFCCKRRSCRNDLMCCVEREQPKLTFD